MEIAIIHEDRGQREGGFVLVRIDHRSHCRNGAAAADGRARRNHRSREESISANRR